MIKTVTIREFSAVCLRIEYIVVSQHWVKVDVRFCRDQLSVKTCTHGIWQQRDNFLRKQAADNSRHYQATLASFRTSFHGVVPERYKGGSRILREVKRNEFWPLPLIIETRPKLRLLSGVPDRPEPNLPTDLGIIRALEQQAQCRKNRSFSRKYFNVSVLSTNTNTYS